MKFEQIYLVNTPKEARPEYEVTDLIVKIEAHIANKSGIEVVKDLLEDLMNGCIFFGCQIAPGKEFIRVVPVDVKPEFVSRISYNPKPPDSNRGSLKNPLFYCSTDITTALSEVVLIEGKKYVISRWSNTKHLFTLPLGLDQDEFRQLENYIAPSINKEHTLSKKIYTPITSKIHKLLGSLFLSADKKSKKDLIDLIAELYYSNDTIESCTYPSTKSQEARLNYAIKNSYVNDGFLKMDEANYIEIESCSEPYRYKVLACTNNATQYERLNWQNLKKTVSIKSNDIVYITNEHGSWQAFDKDQNPIY